ncbi:MAG: TetR/AcrR family transcriptional regulator [Blastocatellales bacterium]
MSSKISAKEEEIVDESCEAKVPGRPRCPLTHQNILKATRELVDEIGFANLTIEGIASRAGVGKTTIYRRWPNKSSIVLDAFFEDISSTCSVADTGKVRQDIRRQLRKLVKELNGPTGCKVATLMANGQFDKEMAEAFRARWIERHRNDALALIKRGMETGEIRKEADPEVLVDALYGPIYFRLLAGHAPLTQRLADDLTDLVIDGSDV